MPDDERWRACKSNRSGCLSCGADGDGGGHTTVMGHVMTDSGGMPRVSIMVSPRVGSNIDPFESVLASMQFSLLTDTI